MGCLSHRSEKLLPQLSSPLNGVKLCLTPFSGYDKLA